MKTKATMFVMMLLSVFMLTGCFKSQVVPPGTVILVLEADGDQNVYKSGSFTSYGRDRVYFVDTKLKTATEKMKILCKDDINMDVDVKWIGTFDTSDAALKVIKERVPATKVVEGDMTGYRLSLLKFYNDAMKDVIRAYTREVVSTYSTEDIRDAREAIQKLVKAKVIKKFSDLKYPVKTIDVMISNLDYPKEITDQRKAIKKAQLEDKKQEALSVAAIANAKRLDAMAKEKGKATLTEARIDAEANKIRSKSLTPEILQMRQWDVLDRVINESRKGDIIIIPYSALGTGIQDAVMTGKAMRR